MGKKENNELKSLKYVFFESVLFPFILLIVALYLKKNGFKCFVPDYEKGIVRIIQYILFFLGLFIFFFCEGISDFIVNRLFIKENKESKKNKQTNFSSYYAYTIIMLWTLNLITIVGFIGFLICGNVTWLAVFLILNISMVYKYFPSKKRFENLISKLKMNKKI